MKAVILAAGVGSRLAPLTNDRPKALVTVDGRPILFRQLDLLAAAGIKSDQVVVVGGYKVDMLRTELMRGGFRCKVILNEKYLTWGNFYSLLCAETELRGYDFLQCDGDVVLDDKILPRMIDAAGDGMIAVDPGAELDDDAMKVSLDDDGRVTGLDKKLDPAVCMGEYIGITKLSARGGTHVFRELAKFEAESLTHEYYDTAYGRLSLRHELPFKIVDVHDCEVLEVDDLSDLKRAEDIVRRRTATA